MQFFLYPFPTFTFKKKMGVDIILYRVRIGCFSMPVHHNAKLDTSCVSGRSDMFFRLVFALTMLITLGGDVEKNPGPRIRKHTRRRQQPPSRAPSVSEEEILPGTAVTSLETRMSTSLLNQTPTEAPTREASNLEPGRRQQNSLTSAFDVVVFCGDENLRDQMNMTERSRKKMEKCKKVLKGSDEVIIGFIRKERQSITNEHGEQTCKALDYLGVSEYMREQHQTKAQEAELFQTFANKIINDISPCMYNTSYFTFGSNSEGTYIPSIPGSDIDSVLCNDSHPIITSLDECIPGVLCFMMLRDQNSKPGYVKLQPVFNGKEITDPNWKYPRNITFKRDIEGRCCLDHETACRELCVYGTKEFERHGPAISSDTGPFSLPIDMVPAFKCASVPSFANAWVSHYKNYVWPSQENIDHMMKLGCFVVAVSHPQSSEPDLEWRVSFSLQERNIMFSLNTVQHKCYVYLKILKSDMLKPRVEDAISSYFLKTSVMYLKTLTADSFWSTSNFHICIRMCLLMFLSFVRKRFYPNFFILDQNLFDKRSTFTASTFKRLEKILYELVYTGVFQLGPQLERKRPYIPDYSNHPDRFNLKFNSILYRDLIRKYYIRLMDVNFYEYGMSRLEQIPGMTSEYHSSQVMQLPKRMLTLLFKTLVMQSCGSLAWNNRLWNFMTSAIKKFQGDDIYQVLAIRWTHDLIEEFNKYKARVESNWTKDLLQKCQEHYEQEPGSQQNDMITSDTVFASVLYMSGNYLEASKILDRATNNDKVDVLTVCCCDSSNHVPVVAGSPYYVTEAILENDILQYIAPCVTFTVLDLPIIPPALYFELIRTRAPKMFTTNMYLYDMWHYWAVVDARVYLYFLRYLVSKSLGQIYNQNQAIKRLKHVIRMAEKHRTFDRESLDKRYWQCCLGHVESAWNLLGWIYMQEGQQDAAVCCFTRSWKSKRDMNAAKWHLALLLFNTLDD